MKLEEKIAYFINLGKIKFEELEIIQKQVLRNSSIPKYLLLHAKVEPHVNFGTNKERNRLSRALEAHYLNILGNKFYDENGNYSEYTIQYFVENGINGFPFTKSKRGGGATVYTPGQYLYFPVWHLTKSKEIKNRFQSIRKFNTQLHNAMLIATNNLIDGAYLVDTVFSRVIQDVNKDLYVEKENMHYKVGAKGIDFHESSGKNIGGFSLFVNSESIELMQNVHVCGFSPEEMQIISMEDIKKGKIEDSIVHKSIISGLEEETEIKFKHMEKDEFLKYLNQ